MNGKWRTVVSPDGAGQTLWIHQQAWFSLGVFEPETTFGYELKKEGNVVYVFLISGEVEIESETLNHRDALCVEEINSLVQLKTNKKSKILVLEIPE